MERTNMYCLDDLLSIKPEDVYGLLEKFEPTTCTMSSDVSVSFYYLRFQDQLPRLDHLINKLCDVIVPYCLDRSKHASIAPTEVRKLYLEAKRKFARPIGGRSGEPGELLSFFMIEGLLGAPKIFSKMSLKTNPDMHIHGSDGVHLGFDGRHTLLYFGESKLYQVHTSAISDALQSVKEFISPSSGTTTYSQTDFEIGILANNLDVPDGELQEHLLRVLDPYSRERSDLMYVFTCLIGFDLDTIKNKCSLDEFTQLYEDKARSCYENVTKKIAADSDLQAIEWRFFFIPFGSVQDFRDKFLNELGA